MAQPRPLPDGQHHAVVCLLPARNAAGDLPGYLDSAARCCDAIVALDDGSTDATPDLLAANPLVKVLLRNPRREDYQRWDDAANRNRLLRAAASLEPEWILSLDADERLDETDARALRTFLQTDALPGCAYGFRHVPMRDDLEHFWPRYQWVYRLFSFEPGQQFPPQRLHFIPVPTSLPRTRWIKTTLRIQHLGGMTPERRLERFGKYLEADPDRQYQADYSNLLLSPPGQHLRRWQPRPEGMSILMAPEAEGLDNMVAAEQDRPDGPVLSVIVIAQNNEATIASSIASIVEQECPDPFEVILVASGTDRTAEIVRSGFSAVRVIELSRPALPGEARNAGLRVATGAYVSFPGSHVQLLPGSLAARLRAHRRGYAMVTGITENGNRTPAGWASYFLDQSEGLPGHRAAELNGPPAHCSYARLPLLEVGGFPEGVRTAEDTAVNRALVHRGYVAYRDPQIRFVHRSPCTTWTRLLQHHYARGQGWGRLLVADHQTAGRLLNRQVLHARLVKHLPQRLARIGHGVATASPELREAYQLVRFGVLGGAVAAWVGMWVEILKPGPGKVWLLLDRPKRNVVIVSQGERTSAWLAQIDHVAQRATVKRLAPELPIPLASGGRTTLHALVGEATGEVQSLPSADSLKRQLAMALDVAIVDYLIGDDAMITALLPRLHPNLPVAERSTIRWWLNVIRTRRVRRLATTVDPFPLLGVLTRLRTIDE